MKAASRIFASRSAGKAPLVPVVPGTQLIAGVYVSCKVVETGYEVVRIAYAIVSSQKPGASYTNHYYFDGAFNYANVTLGPTKVMARPPYRKPPVFSQSNSSMPTAPTPPDTDGPRSRGNRRLVDPIISCLTTHKGLDTYFKYDKGWVTRVVATGRQRGVAMGIDPLSAGSNRGGCCTRASHKPAYPRNEQLCQNKVMVNKGTSSYPKEDLADSQRSDQLDREVLRHGVYNDAERRLSSLNVARNRGNEASCGKRSLRMIEYPACGGNAWGARLRNQRVKSSERPSFRSLSG
ncbi:hypothetical protein F5J12DRAFT_786373 [Pisolithus orientalis]|uniref:uncharacterized protein n=1 Tax=Pisolithus orientalis TaxID=936130 RepID=UPI002224EF12|nr:uncharacterized protein F5J12DRAFT_786373 [Pisolithus orientalis]KAI5991301.1 hypothetical protein F5J12DRAFT_786373 [Pisolithus orientalis]